MATYAIGDVHGCYDSLCALLDAIDYQSTQDHLIFIGDLVNTGPCSLEVLRLIRSLGQTTVVLGNHDLALLAKGYGAITASLNPTLKSVCDASDGMELLSWLRHQRLFHIEECDQAVFVHAGIPPCWTIGQIKMFSSEVEAVLQGDRYYHFLSSMYGQEPAIWSDDLEGDDRLRYIVNALTRMRFCTLQGQLEFECKALVHPHDDFQPWFHWYQQPYHVFFGHWAWLKGQCHQERCYALDTGCVYGGFLTAINVETKQRIQVKARERP